MRYSVLHECILSLQTILLQSVLNRKNQDERWKVLRLGPKEKKKGEKKRQHLKCNHLHGKTTCWSVCMCALKENNKHLFENATIDGVCVYVCCTNEA